jgi:hypothetical protein
MFGRGRKEAVQLTVQNQRFEDAAIYANWSPAGSATASGWLPARPPRPSASKWRADMVQFDIDFIAADGYPTDPIDVSPGDHLDLVILNGSTR